MTNLNDEETCRRVLAACRGVVDEPQASSYNRTKIKWATIAAVFNISAWLVIAGLIITVLE